MLLRPLRLEQMRYAVPSSSLNIDWSPQLPLVTFVMVVCVPAQAKAPLGVSLVAKNCSVSGDPRYCPLSTYFFVVGLYAAPTRPIHVPESKATAAPTLAAV